MHCKWNCEHALLFISVDLGVYVFHTFEDAYMNTHRKIPQRCSIFKINNLRREANTSGRRKKTKTEPENTWKRPSQCHMQHSAPTNTSFPSHRNSLYS